jgi:hypothetical protein
MALFQFGARIQFRSTELANAIKTEKKQEQWTTSF